MSFFESVRLALARHPVGVHCLAPSAAASELASAEQRVGTFPSDDYREFLSTWNGGAMFHESLTLLPASSLSRLSPERIQIGECSDGQIFLDGQGRVRVMDEEEPDPLTAGSDFSTWIDVVMAREALLIDRDGEFRDVFDEEDGVLKTEVRRKRAQLGRKRDRGASLYPLELAELALEDGDDEQALQLLSEAVEHDPQAGPAWELLAALYRQSEELELAHDAYLRAASATPSETLRAMRLLEAAQLQPLHAQALVEAATMADPGLPERLLTQAREHLTKHDVEEAKQLQAKLQLLATHQRLPSDVTPEVERIEKDLRSRDALRVL
ncbi:MAG: hypothetical protein JNM40_21110 [Myxococcales bacterium]|nr:hypothetical protein [Myxococcales bacterium]